jgi:hypothetical protein
MTTPPEPQAVSEEKREGSDAQLREALEFYADERRWFMVTQLVGNKPKRLVTELIKDAGAKARAALHTARAECIALLSRADTSTDKSGEEPQSSSEYQQRRGVAWDIIDQAIVSYDQWMLDDDYDANKILGRIIDKMKERRAFYSSDEGPIEALSTPTGVVAKGREKPNG